MKEPLLKPLLKYVAFIAMLVALVGWNVAHATDSKNPMEAECVEALPFMLIGPYMAAQEGMPLDVIELLVRTDDELPPLVRGVILRALPALQWNPTPEQFLAVGRAVCAMEPITVPAMRRGERDMKPQGV